MFKAMPGVAGNGNPPAIPWKSGMPLLLLPMEQWKQIN
jgi:hypothetical protein